MKSTAYLENERLLAEVNSTLAREGKRTGSKIGIFSPGQMGDAITSSSILKYVDEIFPGKEIIWFCNAPTNDFLRFSDKVDEIRIYPWEDGVDFNTNGMKNKQYRLDQRRKLDFEITADLDDGYFPTPWMMEVDDRAGIEYPNVSKKVFGVPMEKEWHPYLCFSDEERENAKAFCSGLPYKRTVIMETACGSNQSAWHDGLTDKTMRVCREMMGDCNFIFASKVDSSKFFDRPGVVSAAAFTVRQCALLREHSDLFVGISSSISCAMSCWGLRPIPIVQYCGSKICSTLGLADGPFDVIECEKYAFPPKWDHTDAEHAFEAKLREYIKKLN